MNKTYSIKLNLLNEKRFEEIKNKLEAENILNRNSSNEIFNFMVREFALLFLGEGKKGITKQELEYLTLKKNKDNATDLQKLNKEMLNKIKFIDENVEIAIYILLFLNYGTNLTELPDSEFKSILSDGNRFSDVFDKAKNSVERDKRKAHKLKHNYE